MAIKSETMVLKRPEGDATLTASQLPPTRALKLVSKLAEIGILGGDPSTVAASVMGLVQTDAFPTLLGTVTVNMGGKFAQMDQALFDSLFAGSLKEAVEFLTFCIKVQVADFLAESGGQAA